MILITGATGHVGNNLLRSLSKKGETLRLFLQPQESVGALDGTHFDLVVGDIRNPEDVNRAVEGCEKVYHLAGLVDIAPKQVNLLEEVNVLGTRNIVEACLKYNVKRLVFISSVHALPESPKGSKLKELGAAAFPNTTLLGAYAVSKSKATAEVYKGVEKGLDAVMIFPSGIIGPYDHRGSQMGSVLKTLLKAKNMKTYPCFKGGYNFVDVRDVVIALQLAMEHGRSGEGYLITGHSITIPELFQLVARWMGKTTIKLILFPLWLVKFAARIVVKFARLFNKKTFFTPYSIEVLDSNSDMDHSKAVKELGFKPRPLEETINDTLKWFSNHLNNYKQKKTKHHRTKTKIRKRSKHINVA
ncbi:MAG: NAD-dependent epimerase/dehydratase family protein [Fastidiosipilaceae bacterium]|nr:NAD-dependent epimerase/dehydratase family protein [Clostridiaceae bacterium]